MGGDIELFEDGFARGFERGFERGTTLATRNWTNAELGKMPKGVLVEKLREAAARANFDGGPGAYYGDDLSEDGDDDGSPIATLPDLPPPNPRPTGMDDFGRLPGDEEMPKPSVSLRRPSRSESEPALELLREVDLMLGILLPALRDFPPPALLALDEKLQAAGVGSGIKERIKEALSGSGS